tara:strand:- start:2042 stop:2314 length:273 start_codon:yes stop_codon:yes gene_type:complete
VLIGVSFKIIIFYHIILDTININYYINVNINKEKKMEQDQIISSLFNMLQKSNNEKINMQLTIDKLTAELNQLKSNNEKENNGKDNTDGS